MVAVNPLGFCYGSVTNVELFEGASAMLVTGEGNRHHAAFKAARARGVEVLTYLDLTARPIATTNPVMLGIYMNDLARVPLWGRDEVGEWRTNWPGKYLLDTRVGSPWIDYAVEYVANLMRGGEFDGVFLDVVGCRNWGKVSKWDSWPRTEQEEWTAGNVDLVRRLHLKRMEINPDFLLINNNIWIDPGKIDASEAERYVDGICLEGHTATVVKNGQTIPSWHWNHAKRPFGTLGQRRMLVISNSDADALVWKTHPDVTHVTSVNTTLGQSYKAATPPVVKPTDVRLQEALGKVQLLRQQLAAPSDSAAARIAELTRQLEATRLELSATYDQLNTTVEARNALSGRVDALRTKLNTLSEQLTSLAEVARE